jgi:hypothetical protein
MMDDGRRIEEGDAIEKRDGPLGREAKRHIFSFCFFLSRVCGALGFV